MSRERFEWLQQVSGEIIATPGMESNVKEIFDKVWELRRTRQDVVVFNQFDEFGNHLWHYAVTGRAMEEVLGRELGPHDVYRGVVRITGSAGTLGCGDYLKERSPTSKVAAREALQCPTLLYNGYGGHRIEGIGDKHVPWIHNLRNADMVMTIDDEACMGLVRLFNEPAGWATWRLSFRAVRLSVNSASTRGADRSRRDRFPDPDMAAERYATEARSAERRYGGLLETLLGVACRSEVGIGIDVAQLPALPIVSRFAEALQLDRLRMISSGTLVATVLGEHTDGVRKALQALRVPFAFAGRVTGGSGVRVL